LIERLDKVGHKKSKITRDASLTVKTISELCKIPPETMGNHS
jgi:hypothetical protein